MVSELSRHVGKKIKMYRTNKGMTQKELGEAIGVKHNTVSAYETGTISPEQDMLFAISKVLKIRVDDLFPYIEGSEKTDELERALRLAKDLDVENMAFLNELIEKTLSMDEEEREKFLESIKFTVDYYDKMN